MRLRQIQKPCRCVKIIDTKTDSWTSLPLIHTIEMFESWIGMDIDDCYAALGDCDTSNGLLPRPHVLAYYGCFYFFGVATFAAEGGDARLGRHWKLLLPTAVVLLAAGIASMNDRLLATILQPAYAWTMSLGLIGLFGRFLSRPSPAVSWLADASYWMYLVHVPLVMLAQMVVRPWPLPADVKWLAVMAMVTPLLLLSYRYGVRFTAIGRLLNGPRG